MSARDCQLVVMGPYGRIDLAHVTAWDSRLNKTLDRPHGWEGMFELERGSNAADDFIARIAHAYERGDAIPAGTFYQYVAERDGSISTYQYDGAVFRFALDRPAQDTSARQRIEFSASSRRRI